MNRKIAVIAPFGPQIGGMVELARILASMFEDAGFQVLKVNKSTVGRNILGSFMIHVRIFLAALSSGTLVVISGSGKSLWALDLPAVLLGRLFGRRVIIDFVGGAAMEEARSWGRLKKKALKWSSSVVVPTNKMKESMKLQGVDACYKVIPHTVDVGIFRRVARGDKGPKKVVLSAKNMESYANIDQIIKCVSEVSVLVPEVELWIAGSGPEEAELRRLAAVLLPGKAIFLGSVPHDRMPSVLAGTDILLHATKYESFGILLVEAMAAGVPIISYDAGGISDVVEDGVTGLLIDYGDLAGLTEKLLRLLNDKETRSGMGEKGIEASGRYSKGEIMKLWVELLEQNGVSA